VESLKMTAKNKFAVITSRVHVALGEVGVLHLESIIERYRADLPTRQVPMAIVVMSDIYVWLALDAVGEMVWGVRRTKGWAVRDAMAFLRVQHPHLFIQ
jgi:hypothetical protein